MTINVFGGGNTGGPAFPLQRSVRLRSSASAYFNRTPASAGNRKTWTWSGWLKRGTLSSTDAIWHCYGAGTNTTYFLVRFESSGALYIGNASTNFCITSQLFRDPSAWYHIVITLDTTQSTATDRLKVYVNGSQVIAFSSDNRAAQIALNSDQGINQSSVHTIGRENSGTFYLDGYLTEVNFIDGQALTPASFGSINSTTGVWQPIKYTSTYGTNGFYLNFQDNSGATATTIGKDSSGNGNNWTPNNISVTAGVTYDSMLDVPTNTGATNANYAVMNPLNTFTASVLSVSNGNLTVSAGTNSVASQSHSSIGITSGKWYWEVTPTSVAVQHYIGICKELPTINGNPSNYVYWAFNGGIVNNAGTVLNATNWAANDVLGWALDLDSDTLALYKNNTLIYTVTSLRTAMGGIATSDPVVSFNWTGGSSNSITCHWNFGQRPFSGTVPTGFKSLNTYNLPAPTIPNGATQFAATTYTGTGSARSVTNTVNGVSFQPDFVWMKQRSAIQSHVLEDSVRGATKYLVTDSTAAEVTDAQTLTAFNSNGFALGTSTGINNNAATYVGWQWKAGGTAVTNTSGSITSQVSANPSAGFSIVTYTGTGANATVGHGLGVAPKMVIVKARTSAQNWVVQHTSLTSGAYTLYLDSTAAQTSVPTIWNSAFPTSTVFSLGTNVLGNSNTITYVAYCFSEIAGYSKFGSYTGNGSTDGPFVYTGFRPKFILVKNASLAGSNWCIEDTSRDTYNAAGLDLFPNTSDAEVNNTPQFDILSNGFKLRATTAGKNGSGNTIIYAAFAESPFNYSLAR